MSQQQHRPMSSILPQGCLLQDMKVQGSLVCQELASDRYQLLCRASMAASWASSACRRPPAPIWYEDVLEAQDNAADV